MGQWSVNLLYCTVDVTKRELSQKAKLSIYRSIFTSTLTYRHEGWVMTKLKLQAALNGPLQAEAAKVSLP